MICRFACVKPIVKQGSIINIKGTNIAYVSPHIITIKKNNYLIFNGSDTLFVNNYSNSIINESVESFYERFKILEKNENSIFS